MDFLGEVGACQPCTSGRACTRSFNLFSRTVACIAHAHTTSMWTNRLKLQCTFTQTNMFATWDPEWAACVTYGLTAFVHSRCFCLAAELQANYALSTQIFNRATDLQLYIYIVLVNYGQVALFLQLRESVRGMGHIPGYCLILVYLTYAVLSNS